MNKRFLKISVLLVLAVLLVAGGAVYAQSGGYSLFWWTVDGGGGRLSSGNYTLRGTIAQADAGPPLASGDYALVGGFWGIGTEAAGYRLYLPAVLKNP